jgi:DNA-binding NarL/FixJ family response regulator
MAHQRKRQRSPKNNQGLELTNRESDILNQLICGICNKAIAAHLGITVNTVEKHLTRIYDKLGTSSRAETILLCLTKGGGFRNSQSRK